MQQNSAAPSASHEEAIAFRLPSSLGRIKAKTILDKSNKLASIWFFYSPKNNQKLTLVGDMLFVKAVLLEGDPSVIGYDVAPAPVVVKNGDAEVEIAPAMQIFTDDGKMYWMDFARLEGKTRKPKVAGPVAEYAAEKSIRYELITDVALRRHQVNFDNWILLCSAITRCRSIRYESISRAVLDRIRLQGVSTLQALCEGIDADPALILASVARGLQRGIYSTDLDNLLFGVQSAIRVR